MQRVALVLPAALALCAASGCSRGTTTTGASEGPFRAEANRTCSDVARRLRGVDHHLSLAATVKEVRIALVPLEQLHPPAGDARAYHRMVAGLDAALAFDSTNRAKLVALGRRFNSIPPLSKRYIPMHKRLDRFLFPVLHNDFGPAPAGLKACNRTVEAAQSDLVPFPPFDH